LGTTGLQQPQLAGCLPDRREVSGALALRSLVANAFRRADPIMANMGTDSRARGAASPQSGQGCG
jgi:hypothetical protein